MQNNNVCVIATHNGAFHADDVFGVAVLLALNPQAAVVRTRDPKIIGNATFAVDVGGEWEPHEGKFDHHQKGFNGQRLSGVFYASAGLVWLAHGKELIEKTLPNVDPTQAGAIRKLIDVELVQYLDMADTGAANNAPGLFGLSALISMYNTTRVEEKLAGWPEAVAEAKLVQFLEAVRMVQGLLKRLILQFADELAGAAIVRGAERLADGKILVLPESGLSWAKVVCNEMPEVLFVVYPDSTDNQYQVRTVPIEPESFKARRDLPESWAGLRNDDLAKVTGVADAVFCHNGRFIGGAGSKEGALLLARLALL